MSAVTIRRMLPGDLAAIDVQPAQMGELGGDLVRIGRDLVAAGLFWTGLEGGRPIGLGGAMEVPGDWPMVFMVMSAAAVRHRVTLYRAAKLFLHALDEDGVERVWTVHGPGGDFTGWLRRHGFVPAGMQATGQGQWPRWERARGH